MKLGLENKKETAALAVLAVVAGYLLYANVLSGPDAPTTPAGVTPAAVEQPLASASAPSRAPSTGRPPGQAVRSDEFHPVLRSKRPEDRIDPTKVDPTLLLDALERLQQVASDGANRNLFQFGTPPPPPQPKAVLNAPEPVITPRPQPPTPPMQPAEPPPVPIPLKYFGISTARRGGVRTAFFLDGDDIVIAGEGDLLKKRYRVVRIGATSVVLEDTQLKREQSLALADEAASRAPG